MHFRKNEAGDWVCGLHKRTQARPSDHSDCTDDPFIVDCARCMASPAYKKALAEKRARKAAHHSALREGGFDPNKKLSEMTPEEVEAFIAWTHAKK